LREPEREWGEIPHIAGGWSESFLPHKQGKIGATPMPATKKIIYFT